MAYQLLIPQESREYMGYWQEVNHPGTGIKNPFIPAPSFDYGIEGAQKVCVSDFHSLGTPGSPGRKNDSAQVIKFYLF